MALYKPTGATLTVSGTTWQVSIDDGTTWTTTPATVSGTLYPQYPTTSDDIFLNGISLSVDINLSANTIRNTTTYNKAGVMTSVTGVSAGGKLSFNTTGRTLTLASNGNADTTGDGSNCLAGSSLLMDNAGATTPVTLNFNNVRVKGGAGAANSHGFSQSVAQTVTINGTNNCRFQGSDSTSASFGYSITTATATTFQGLGYIEFRGGNVTSAYGLFSNTNAAHTVTIHNDSDASKQIKFMGGGASNCYGFWHGNSNAMNISIGQISSDVLNVIVEAGTGAGSGIGNSAAGILVSSTVGTFNISLGATSNTNNVIKATGNNPAIYISSSTSLSLPVNVYKGTIVSTGTMLGVGGIFKLNVNDNDNVRLVLPKTISGTTNFYTSQTTSGLTAGDVWSYSTRELTSAKNITSDDTKINSTAIKTSTDRIPLNPASIESTGDQIAAYNT
jgi:hypothetical protein